MLVGSERAQDRRVVVGQTNVRITGPETRERRLEQRPRCEKACGSLRKAVEVGKAEAHRPRTVEVVPPRELCQQPPEVPQQALGLDVHVAVPHRLPRDAVVHEAQGIRNQLHARIEEENIVPSSRRKTGSSRLEASTVGLGHDTQREPSVDGRTSDVRTPVSRAVVDKDELGVEATAVDRGRESLHRPHEVSPLVEHRHDDTERVT